VPICVLESRYREIERGASLGRIGETSLTATDALHRSAVSAARKSATMITVSMRKSIPSAKQGGLRCVNSRCRTRWKPLFDTALQNSSLSTWREDCAVLLNRGTMPKRPLERMSLHDQLVAKVREMIVDGERLDPAISRRTRMDQTCLGRGAFSGR
jgi:hypothetical protein